MTKRNKIRGQPSISIWLERRGNGQGYTANHLIIGLSSIVSNLVMDGRRYDSHINPPNRLDVFWIFMQDEILWEKH